MNRVFDDSHYRDKSGYVYLIRAIGTRRFKIGLTTRDVEQRFNELNGSQSPYPLELITFIETDNVTETEGYLHQRYALQRRHREWFEFSNRQLREVLREYDRLENGYRSWFPLPSLPSINLPSLPSIGFPQWNPNTIALLVAGVGAVWLMVGFSSCSPQQSQQPTTLEQQR